MKRALPLVLLVACNPTVKAPAPVPDANTATPGFRRAQARIVHIPEGSFCPGRQVGLDLVGGGTVYDGGICWWSEPHVGDTIDVEVGRVPARVVAAEEESSNCGGTHLILEAVVDGRTLRLHAGGHCLHGRAWPEHAPTQVTVDAILMPRATVIPNPGAWLGDLGPVDGFATVVAPSSAVLSGNP